MHATLRFGLIFKCFDKARVGIEAAQLNWGYHFVEISLYIFVDLLHLPLRQRAVASPFLKG